METLTDMKRLIIILLFAPYVGFSQKTDSLKKYSYRLYGNDKGYFIENNLLKIKTKHSTCFFIRYRKNTYLISAAHALTGLNHKGMVKDNTYPDTLRVALYNKYSNKEEDYKFSIVHLKNNTPANFYTNHADVMAYKIYLPEKYIVNYVDKFIKNGDLTKVKYAVTFGFPISGNSIERCVLDERNYVFINSDENLKNKTLAFNMKQGNVSAGYSGAPLLFITYNNDIVFGGLCMGLAYGKAEFVMSGDVFKSIIDNQHL